MVAGGIRIADGFLPTKFAVPGEVLANLMDRNARKKLTAASFSYQLSELAEKHHMVITDPATGKKRAIQYQDMFHKGEDGHLHATDKAVEVLDELEKNGHLDNYEALAQALEDANNLEGKTAEGAAKLVTGVAVGAAVPGAVAGTVVGMGAGYFSDPLIEELLGNKRNLNVVDALQALNDQALRNLSKDGKPHGKTTIDKSLLAAYIMVANPKHFKDYNTPQFQKDFIKHMQEKGPDKETKLDADIAAAEEEAFASYMIDGLMHANQGMTEEQANQLLSKATQGGKKSVLDVIAENAVGQGNDQKTLGDIVFKPDNLMHTITMRAQGRLPRSVDKSLEAAKLAGKGLPPADQVQGFQGLPPAGIPVNPKAKPPHNFTMST